MAEKIIAPNVSLVNGSPATTSLAIAECFGKRHDVVIRDIRNLIANCPHDFNVHNFVEVEYSDAKGEKRPMYHVFFDGFILLVMGYTGKKALAMKLAYIEAFNAMRRQLEGKTPEIESKEDRARRLAKERQTRFKERKRLALESNEPDKYAAYMEEVEDVRARTFAAIDALLQKGLDMIDIRKFGTGAIVGFTPILLDWLQRVVSQHAPLISSREPLARALDYSPLYLIRHMEKMQGCK